MAELNYQKQAQDFYGQAPVIIMGSGASAAHGMSGMEALAKFLIEHTETSGLSHPELESWQNFCLLLDNGTDLETALHQVAASEELTSKIVKATWKLINSEDMDIFQSSLKDSEMFPLSSLLEHMFRGSV